MSHYEVKCHKALWLQVCEALWSNCKWTQSSELRFFLCKKYELLLSLAVQQLFLLTSWYTSLSSLLFLTPLRCETTPQAYSKLLPNFSKGSITDSHVTFSATFASAGKTKKQSQLGEGTHSGNAVGIIRFWRRTKGNFEQVELIGSVVRMWLATWSVAQLVCGR